MRYLAGVGREGRVRASERGEWRRVIEKAVKRISNEEGEKSTTCPGASPGVHSISVLGRWTVCFF